MHIRDMRPLALVLALALIACGDDDPAAPRDGDGPATGTLELSTDAIDWGAKYHGSGANSFPVYLSVPADAAGPVSGVAAPRSDSSDRFTITKNAGAFTLQPGEELEIELTYEPGSPGEKSVGAIEFGVQDLAVELSGFSSDYATIIVQSAGSNQIGANANYQPFLDDGAFRTHAGTGRTDGADAAWIDCASSGGWIFNGQGLTESKMGFGVRRPGGVSTVRVRVRMEAESDCVQTLVQVDGRENKYEGMGGCHTLDNSYAISQDWTDIYVGTDQQGFCGDDLHVRWVEAQFVGRLVTEAEWVDGL